MLLPGQNSRYFYSFCFEPLQRNGESLPIHRNESLNLSNAAENSEMISSIGDELEFHRAIIRMNIFDRNYD